MSKFITIIVLIFVAIVGWKVGARLSPDALGMVLGLLFGVMAGIPMALMVAASGRQTTGGRPTDDQQMQRLTVVDVIEPDGQIVRLTRAEIHRVQR